MAIVESYYKLVIQCNGPTHIFPTLGTFYGDNLGRTKKRARNQGWKFRPENVTICPSCAVDEAQKRKKGRKKKMGTTRRIIREWLEKAQAEGATHMIVVCDTFDWDDYPVMVMPKEKIEEKIAEYDGKSMQKIMEVYNLSMDIDEQLAEKKVWNC